MKGDESSCIDSLDSADHNTDAYIKAAQNGDLRRLEISMARKKYTEIAKKVTKVIDFNLDKMSVVSELTED